MSIVTKISDGYAATVGCDDGGLIELQCVDEETRAKTWELLWSKGTEVTLHGMSPQDIWMLSEALQAFVEAIEKQQGNKAPRHRGTKEGQA